MDLSIHIQAETINTAGADLYIAINAQELSYIILENGLCEAMVINHFEPGASDETISGHIHQFIIDHPILQEKFNSTHIIYGYAQSVLIPEAYMNNDYAPLLELVYGDMGERTIKADFIEHHDVHNVYGIPSVVDMVMTRYFGFAGHTHLFSCLPGILKEPGNHLYCIFSTGELRLLLLMDDRLMLMQTYLFATPVDVAYQLLNICTRFNVAADNVNVHLTGMIETNHALYNELYKYFLHLQFEPLPARFQYPEAFAEYPAHYFSHLFAIATCV